MTAKPTAPQLRFLLYLIANGGRAYNDTFRGATVRSCVEQGWAEQCPGEPFDVHPYRITVTGCDEAQRAEPLAAEVRDSIIDKAVPEAVEVTTAQAAHIAATARSSRQVIAFTRGWTQ